MEVLPVHVIQGLFKWLMFISITDTSSVVLVKTAISSGTVKTSGNHP